jgi:hypothetical protein
MKPLSAIIFLYGMMILIAISCKKTNDSQEVIWEIPLNGDKTITANSIDGNEFKFCLIDKAGDAKTSFNEGENFSFYYSVTNNSDKRLYIDPSFTHTKYDITNTVSV